MIACGGEADNRPRSRAHPVRPLTNHELDALLNADVVAHLATIDTDGYPHVTPIWFLWADNVFHLTSYTDRPHLDRIRANPRVGLVLDVEEPRRPDGQRPNRQLRITGDATVSSDVDRQWTARIRGKYLGSGSSPDAERALVKIVPRSRWAVASV
jgi:PPOX class probable F420-dependent enzyme